MLKRSKGGLIKLNRISQCLPVNSNTVILNGKYEMPYRADSGADRTCLSWAAFQLAQVVLPELISTAVGEMCVAEPVGGGELQICGEVRVQLTLRTAAGLVEIVEPFVCLIYEGEGDEFLVGEDLLMELGIDVNAQLEQLGSCTVDRDDELQEEVEIIASEPTDAGAQLERLIGDAVAQGFPVGRVDALRGIVTRYDIWRMELGPDPPARVPPLEIQFKVGIKPYRCNAREYAPFLQTLLDTLTPPIPTIPKPL